MISANEITRSMSGLETQSLAAVYVLAPSCDAMPLGRGGPQIISCWAPWVGVLPLRRGHWSMALHGTTQLRKAVALHTAGGVKDVGLWIGMAMVRQRADLKVSPAPFHMLDPDLYMRGAPRR